MTDAEAIEFVKKWVGECPVPIVNLNGTSKQELLDQLFILRKAHDDFTETLAKFLPHPRDYQVNPAGDYQKARDSYNRILRVSYYLTQWFYTRSIEIYEQGK